MKKRKPKKTASKRASKKSGYKNPFFSVYSDQFGKFWATAGAGYQRGPFKTKDEAVAAGKRLAELVASKHGKRNPETPQETALHLVAKLGKRAATALAKRELKHARIHRFRADERRWKAVERGIGRVHIGAPRARSSASSPKKKGDKNPLLAVVNPHLRELKVGEKCRFKDLPEELRKDKRVVAAARDAAKFDGVKLENVKVEVGLVPEGDPNFLTGIGALKGIQYAKGRGSARKGLWWHEAGDHGKGKKKTKAQVVAADPRTGRMILVNRQGTRAGFKADRGLVG